MHNISLVITLNSRYTLCPKCPNHHTSKVAKVTHSPTFGYLDFAEHLCYYGTDTEQYKSRNMQQLPHIANI